MFEYGEPQPALADDLFRWAMADGIYEETGHVDGRYGHTTHVTLSSVDIARYVSEAGDPWASTKVQPGQYLVNVNSDGVLYAFGYGVESELQADWDAAVALSELLEPMGW